MIVSPFTYDSVEDIDETSLPFPQIEDQDLAEGWEPTDQEWMVDHSGFGSPGERALTIDQFLAVLRTYLGENPSHGFAITGVGQFQLFVRTYRRIV